MHRKARHRHVGQNFHQAPGGDVVLDREPQNLGDAGAVKRGMQQADAVV